MPVKSPNQCKRPVPRSCIGPRISVGRAHWFADRRAPALVLDENGNRKSDYIMTPPDRFGASPCYPLGSRFPFRRRRRFADRRAPASVRDENGNRKSDYILTPPDNLFLRQKRGLSIYNARFSCPKTRLPIARERVFSTLAVFGQTFPSFP